MVFVLQGQSLDNKKTFLIYICIIFFYEVEVVLGADELDEPGAPKPKYQVVDK
jgi:hypothetical protein